jgi:hypothetical protein
VVAGVKRAMATGIARMLRMSISKDFGRSSLDMVSSDAEMKF